MKEQEELQFLQTLQYPFAKLPQPAGTYQLKQPGGRCSGEDNMLSSWSMVQVWKGAFYGQSRRKKPILISILEGYTYATASNVAYLAAGWPDELRLEGFVHII